MDQGLRKWAATTAMARTRTEPGTCQCNEDERDVDPGLSRGKMKSYESMQQCSGHDHSRHGPAAAYTSGLTLRPRKRGGEWAMGDRG